MQIRSVHVRFPNKKPRTKIIKFMTILFKTLHLLFGLNLGFFAHKSLKFRLFSYLFPIIQIIILGVNLLFKIYKHDIEYLSSWTVQFFLEYVIVILLLSLFKRGTTIMDLQESLEEIDVKLQADCSHITELKFILMVFFIFIQRILVSCYYCIFIDHRHCSHSIVDIYDFLVLSSCLDIALSCYVFVFYSLYLRLTKLSFMLETNYDIDYVQRQYKTIVDAVEKYKKAFDPLYMLMLLSNVPQVMATIYIFLQILQKQNFAVAFLMMSAKNIYVLEVFVLTIAPALTAEMLTTQAKKIKIILHDIRLQQGDQNMESLTRFIKYVEARPCRYHVWKLIPLSADLLSMVLSFCVTYLIVIIQFTSLK